MKSITFPCDRCGTQRRATDLASIATDGAVRWYCHPVMSTERTCYIDVQGEEIQRIGSGWSSGLDDADIEELLRG